MDIGIGLQHQAQRIGDFVVVVLLGRHDVDDIHHVAAASRPPRQYARQPLVGQADDLSRERDDAVRYRDRDVAAGISSLPAQRFPLPLDQGVDGAVLKIDVAQQPLANGIARAAVAARLAGIDDQAVDDLSDAGDAGRGGERPFLESDMRHLARQRQGAGFELHGERMALQVDVRFMLDGRVHLLQNRLLALHGQPPLSRRASSALPATVRSNPSASGRRWSRPCRRRCC